MARSCGQSQRWTLPCWLRLALLGVLLAVTLQGVQCEEPTESQCRPYIEKALKEQHVASSDEQASTEQEENPPTDELTDSNEDPTNQDNDSEEATGEADDEDDDTVSDDATEEDTKDSTEDVGGETEEDGDGSDDKTAEETETGEDQASIEGDTKEEDDNEESANGDTEEKDDDGDESGEDDNQSEAESVEGDTNEEGEEDHEGSTEGDDGNTEEDQSGDDDTQTEEQKESIEGDTEEQQDEEDGSEEAGEPGTEEESGEDVGTPEDGSIEGDTQEQGDGESVEGDTKEDESDDDKDDAEGDEGEDNEDGEASAEGDETDEGASVEGDTKEEGSVEGDTKEDDDGSVEGDTKEEEGSVEGDTKEDEDGSVERDTKEDDDGSVEGDTKEDEDGSVEGDTKENEEGSVEGDTKEDDDNDKDTKEETEEEGESADGEGEQEVSAEGDTKEEGSEEGGEGGSGEEDSKDEDDEAAAESDEEDGKSKEESSPEEEELTNEVDIPDNLRPRDHITQILRLDQDSVETESVLAKAIDNTLKTLKGLYDNAIKPLEILYKYRDLSNRHFGDPEIFSKPLILFMGPWSGGKSSTINYLLNNEFTPMSLRTGAEPSPAYFNILMYGSEEEILDGTQLAADWTFSGLQKFGQGLLDRLRGVRLPNRLLEKVNIVEIPGILEIRKQVQRLFPFNDACQWFIDRADIIFLVYDPAKLDVGPETEAILDQLKGREYQTRIILNKADQVKPEELMRVQGTLIWNISPLMSSMEPPIMYSTSLWSLPYETGAPTRLLLAQERAFLRDLREAIDKRVENKIASARRFAVRVRNHAKMVDCYLTTYYNHKTFFGNRKKISDDIIESPQKYHIYEGLSTLTNISRYDLPDPDVYRDFFKINPLYDFTKLSDTCTYFRGCPINKLDIAIAYDLPELIGKYKKALEAAKEQISKSNS